MKNIIVTEISLPTKLFRSGLLRYFDRTELQFHIPDFCYYYKYTLNDRNIHDRGFAKRMNEQGMLIIAELNEAQMLRHQELLVQYKPKFLAKSVSALVLAEITGFRLISEDGLLREVASQDFQIRAHNKEWLLTDLVHEIGVRGIQLDLELVKELL